ncbi:MAG: HD domain-containing protein [Treponema sp.]|nr:HD domain-containing protein [Treponema sp.]
MCDILRRTVLINKSRRENDAEHSWHIAVMAQLFLEYTTESIDIGRVVRMLVIHDLIEIYAGDTFAYDVKGNEDKKSREIAAADKIFAILPEDQGAEIRLLWEEFDDMKTSDAKYAACMDRIQPFLNNTLTNGHTWMEGKTKRWQVEERMSVVKKMMPEVYEWVEENIQNAVNNKWISE